MLLSAHGRHKKQTDHRPTKSESTIFQNKKMYTQFYKAINSSNLKIPWACNFPWVVAGFENSMAMRWKCPPTHTYHIWLMKIMDKWEPTVEQDQEPLGMMDWGVPSNEQNQSIIKGHPWSQDRRILDGFPMGFHNYCGLITVTYLPILFCQNQVFL